LLDAFARQDIHHTRIAVFALFVWTTQPWGLAR
jgi:hypothetical protein